MASDLEQVAEFYLVNAGKQVVCEFCAQSATKAPWHVAFRLKANQLRELKAEDIADKCDFCGLPFFTRMQ